MYKLGLTGGIATGKSTVVKYIKAQLIPVIDADAVAHDLLTNDQEMLIELRDAFGDEIFEGVTLSRKKLGQRVFGDDAALNTLNSITHPRIFTKMAQMAATYEAKGVDLIVYDIPLLLETKPKMDFDGIAVVEIDEAAQLRRLIARNQLSEVDAKKRIEAQMPIAEKVKQATFVIDNNGPLVDTYAQVQHMLDQIKLKKQH